MSRKFEVLTKAEFNGSGSYIAVVSHGDLDGIGAAAIVAKALTQVKINHIVMVNLDPTGEATYEMISYGKVVRDMYARKIGDDGLEFGTIILDRNICSAKELESVNAKCIHWGDHHATSINAFNENRMDYLGLHVNEYLTLNSYESGTTMALEIAKVILESYSIDTESLSQFSAWEKVISLWDTFTWKKGPHDEITEFDIEGALMTVQASYVLPAKMLFFMIYGNCYANSFLKLQFAADIYNSKLEKSIAEAKDSAYEYMLVKTAYNFLKDVSTTDSKHLKLLIAKDVDPTNVSLFADRMCETEGVDVVIVINNGLVSGRVSQKCSVDISHVMKALGTSYGFSGGGHAKAAGCKYRENNPGTPDIEFKEVSQKICDLFEQL